MSGGFIGLGTVINIGTVTLGSSAGMLLGQRLRESTRSIVTDCLALVTFLMAAGQAAAVNDTAFSRAVPTGAPMLIVLGSLIIGSVCGSLLAIEQRLGSLAGVLQRRMHRGESVGSAARERFVEGWLTASLLFCVGPLTILGSINDGLGRGIDQLALKSVLDLFASMAFASTFGIGVLMSVFSIAVVQGGLTLVGVALGNVLTDAEISALTATGGLMLVAIALRLLDIKRIPVGDMLPALIVAPLLTAAVAAFS